MAKILVPTDDSRCSQSALKHAASLARHSDSSLVILHVVESGSTFPLVENEKAKDPLHHEFGQLLKSLS